MGKIDYLAFRRQQEEKLARCAAKSHTSLGRVHPLSTPSEKRTEYERDSNRILHSLAFRRLRHKTQVFFAPRNDHICTRMEHSLHVQSVALTIADCLRLNCDLVTAIALGHDLGHPPFGHQGERTLDRMARESGLLGFSHEAHSLRIVDRYMEDGGPLNLTFEVRDGIACHCGEKFEHTLLPMKKSSFDDLYPHAYEHKLPATLEGCLVRMVDKVAYLGRDFEDAILAGIVRREDLPPEIADGLGQTNGEIIGNFVDDIVSNSDSRGECRIAMSKGINDLMYKFLDFNERRIYNGEALASNKISARSVVRQLFRHLSKAAGVIRQAKRHEDLPHEYKNLDVYRTLYEFINVMQYDDSESDAQVAVDYIAGMTDNFALRAFEQIYMLRPIV